MLPATQNRIFDAVFASLAPGGLFTTFAYVHARWLPTSLRFRQRLFRHFSRIEVTPIVWRNLPPAFVYRCWRDK
jgi:phospholipid N-methyltransferase